MLEARVKQAVVLKKLLDGKPVFLLQLKTKAHGLRVGIARYTRVIARYIHVNGIRTLWPT